MSSRRKFLAISAATLTVASLPKCLLAERIGGEVFTSGSLGAYAQGILSQTVFQKLIGTEFRAFLDSYAVGYMRLESVTGGTPSSSPGTPQRGGAAIAGLRAPQTPVEQAMVSFQVSFSTGGAKFPQGTYLLDHATLGRFACFLVPSDPVGGPTCSATFCYLSSSILEGPSRLMVPQAPLQVPISASAVAPSDTPEQPGPSPNSLQTRIGSVALNQGMRSDSQN
jgi:hypothetical protein